MGSAPIHRRNIWNEFVVPGALPVIFSLWNRPIYPWCLAAEFVTRVPGLPEKLLSYAHLSQGRNDQRWS